MKKYVRISSTKYINVFPSLELSVDVTSDNEANTNRLNAESYWQDLGVRIIEGVWYYPAVITTWNAVKSLAEQEIINIGNEIDNLSDIDEEKRKYAEGLYDMLSKAYKGIESKGFKNPFKEDKPATPKKSSKADTTSTKNLIDDTEE